MSIINPYSTSNRDLAYNYRRIGYTEGYEKGKQDAIEEYSNKLWQVIERATVSCKFDFNIDDLHNLEVIIKGLAEEMKGDLK